MTRSSDASLPTEKSMTTTPMSHTWVTCRVPRPHAQLRLFCFPYAGGGSVTYYHWPRKLPDAIEVYAVKLPGRENRFTESPFTRLEPLVRTLADALLPYLDRPFAFFGHSLGGLLSFELTHALRRQHRLTPVHLCVSASRAPHLCRSGTPKHDLPTPDFIRYLRRINGTPEKILNNNTVMQLLLPTLRADFALAETYHYSPKEPLSCPITVFAGLQDTIVSHEALRAWQQHTRNTFTLHTFPGSHFFLQTARTELLTALTQTLTPQTSHMKRPDGPCGR